MIVNIKKVITNGFLVYMCLVFAYIIFFFLVIYFKNLLHDIHDAYMMAINLIVLLNLNIMSVIFIKKFNKINRKIDDLAYDLTFNTKEEYEE